MGSSHVKCTNLFTYGTLRVGQGNSTLLDETGKYIETVKTKDKFIMFTNRSRSFPYIIYAEYWPEMRQYSCEIIGDVYSVTPSGINLCDSLEGHPDWYIRTTIDLIKYKADVYILTRESFNNMNKENIIILNGNWL